MGVIGIGVGTAKMGRICRDKDGNITEQSTARWDADQAGGSVAIWPMDPEKMEPSGPAEDYGKTWACYAYPPAHIDREGWECPICNSYEVISFKAWKKPEQVIGGPFAQGGAMFCPHCGKPRTPEAWAELEKRLRG